MPLRRGADTSGGAEQACHSISCLFISKTAGIPWPQVSRMSKELNEIQICEDGGDGTVSLSLSLLHIALHSPVRQQACK